MTEEADGILFEDRSAISRSAASVCKVSAWVRVRQGGVTAGDKDGQRGHNSKKKETHEEQDMATVRVLDCGVEWVG